jgi:DNA polymerase-1
MRKRCFIDTETNEGAIERVLTDVWCVAVKVEGEEPIIFTDNYAQNIQPFLDEYTPVFHNSSFDIWVLEQVGCKVGFPWHDTMLIHYLIDPTSSHSLKDLGEYLGCDKLPFSDFSSGYTDTMGEYCKQDVRVTEKIFNEFFPKLKEDTHLLKLYVNIELPFVRVIIDLESNGVRINKGKWESTNEELLSKQQELHSKIMELAPLQLGKPTTVKKARKEDTVSETPELDKYYLVSTDGQSFNYKKWIPFNPSSPVHIKDVLGLEKSDAEALSECTHPLASLLLEYKKLAKLTGSFGASLLSKVQPDGRLHPSYNQCVTKTGRLSCSKPNVQQIPSRGEHGDTLRSLFIPDDGNVLVGIDADSMQMRVYALYLALMCPEYPDAFALFDDFNNNPNADAHQALADLLGIERRIAKTLNFATLFGASVAKAAQTAGTTEREMEGFMKKKEEQFPSDKVLKERIIQACKSNNGVIHDLYGRAGYYRDIYSRDWGMKGAAERQAFNFVIQGTEASVLKGVGIECRKRLGSLAKMVLAVHDEFVFECTQENSAQVITILNEVFNTVPWLHTCKFSGTANAGNNWFEVH